MFYLNDISKVLDYLALVDSLLGPRIEILVQFWVTNVSLESLLSHRNWLRDLLIECIQKCDFPYFRVEIRHIS